MKKIFSFHDLGISLLIIGMLSLFISVPFSRRISRGDYEKATAIVTKIEYDPALESASIMVRYTDSDGYVQNALLTQGGAFLSEGDSLQVYYDKNSLLPVVKGKPLFDTVHSFMLIVGSLLLLAYLKIYKPQQTGVVFEETKNKTYFDMNGNFNSLQYYADQNSSDDDNYNA